MGKKVQLNYKSPITDDEKMAACQKKCDWYNRTTGDLSESDGYDCPICKNKGYIQKPFKSEFGYWVEMNYPCECTNTRRMLRQLEKSGLSKKIRDCTFQKYEATEDWQKIIKSKAMKFTQDDSKNWFFIGGASGCGKTHICTAICRHYLGQGKSVRYMLWRDDVVKLKSSLNDAIEYERMINDFKNTPVLYIDDLFKTGKSEGAVQKPTAADVNLAFELLNYRYNNPELITIISSESRIQDILDIDEAVAGRIVEMSGEYSINIKPDRSKNYRMKDMLEL